MTILEAMSCGLPVVASAVGGNSALVNNSNGDLYPFDRTDLFQARVIDLLSNYDILKSKGIESRKRIEKIFSIKSVVERYENIYCSLMNN
jgi:glycosyltransferase involved in cell wall biosynthesis